MIALMDTFTWEDAASLRQMLKRIRNKQYGRTKWLCTVETGMRIMHWMFYIIGVDRLKKHAKALRVIQIAAYDGHADGVVHWECVTESFVVRVDSALKTALPRRYVYFTRRRVQDILLVFCCYSTGGREGSAGLV